MMRKIKKIVIGFVSKFIRDKKIESKSIKKEKEADSHLFI
jgi:hypothetical protein